MKFVKIRRGVVEKFSSLLRVRADFRYFTARLTFFCEYGRMSSRSSQCFGNFSNYLMFQIFKNCSSIPSQLIDGSVVRHFVADTNIDNVFLCLSRAVLWL